MRARVFDKDTGKYFVSEVYAIVNSGIYKKYLVVQNINNDKYFRLIDNCYITKKQIPYPNNIEVISANDLPEPWTIKDESFFDDINSQLKSKKLHRGIQFYSGFSFILEMKEFLLDLFVGRSIPYNEIMIERDEICTKLDNWNYVETNDDIAYLMRTFDNFEDTVLKSIDYISGSEYSGEGLVSMDRFKKVSMIFDSFTKSIEMVFEGTLLLTLHPYEDYWSSCLSAATIIIKDHIVSFYDGTIDKHPEKYDGTWIKALGLRWRVLTEWSTT